MNNIRIRRIDERITRVCDLVAVEQLASAVLHAMPDEFERLSDERAGDLAVAIALLIDHAHTCARRAEETK